MVNQSSQDAIPLPLLTEEWFKQRFPDMGAIHVLEGLGEHWKKRKLDSVIVVAFHADLEVAQLKHFFPLFFTEYLINSGYSVNSVVYIGALRDIGRGYHRGDIRERVAEAHDFFRGIFTPSTKVVIVEDRIEIQRDVYSILRILEFEKSLQAILAQIKTPEKLWEAKTVRLSYRLRKRASQHLPLREKKAWNRNQKVPLR